MVRRLSVAFILSICGVRTAVAQDIAGLTFVAAGIGWFALGVGSVARLAERGTEAGVGDTVRFDVAATSTRAFGAAHIRGALLSITRDSIAVATNLGPVTYARR